MATVRLGKVKEKLGDKIEINFKSFPLAIEHDPNRRFNSYTAEAWHRANLEAAEAEDAICLKPWRFNDETYPKSSMPAQIASKCALMQGKEPFDRFHLALMKAYFEQNKDVSDTDVLLPLARDAGLDIEKFAADLKSESLAEAVLGEYREAQTKYPGMGVPLAVFGGRYDILGAVPIQLYWRAVDLLLEG